DLDLADRLSDRCSQGVANRPGRSGWLRCNSGKISVGSSLRARNAPPLSPVVMFDQTLIVAGAVRIVIARGEYVAQFRRSDPIQHIALAGKVFAGHRLEARAITVQQERTSLRSIVIEARGPDSSI